MPIPKYTRPQSTISQLLRVTPDRVVNRQNTIVIGPQYKLVINDGRKIPTTAFAAAGAGLTYQSVDGGVTSAIDLSKHKVDTAGVKLFGKNLEAEIGSIDEFKTTANGAANRITLPNTGTRNVTGAAGANTLHPNMDGRNIRVGDVMQITVDNSEATPGTHVADETFYRKVVGFIPRTLTPTVGAVQDSASNFTANGTSNLALLSGPNGHTLESLVLNGDSNQFFKTGGRFGSQLGEELTIVCVVAGGAGVATYRVSYTAKGTSETVVATDDAGKLQLTLTEYDNSTINIGGTSIVTTVGDTYKARIFPAHANNAKTTLAASGTYAGTIDTTYVVEVVEGSNNNAGVVSIKLRVYDTQDSDVVQNYTVTGATNVSLGTKGLSLAITPTATGNPDFAKGDKFFFAVTSAGASTAENVGVILDGPAFNPASFSVASGSFRVSVREPFTGELTKDHTALGATGVAYTAEDAVVNYTSGLGLTTAKVATPRAAFVDGRGEVILSYRAAIKPGVSEGPILVDEVTDTDALGENSVLNDLAYGTRLAFRGSQGERAGRFVYALRTAEDSVEAFKDALRKIESTDVYYNLAVLTEKEEVMSLVRDHCIDQSTPKRKNFRRCYVGSDVEGAYQLLGKRVDGTSRKATVSGDVLSISAVDLADTDLTLLNVRVGDEVRFPSLGTTHAVVGILSATELQIKNPPAAGVTPASAFTIWKTGTAQDNIDFVKARSGRLNSRRCTHVWVDNGLVGTNVVPARFVAAEVAGLRSALLPQQGLTYTELNSIESAPSMYTKYTSDQLDDAASHGVMVVTQESEGGEVFIRHQLTTETDEGILAWEDNIGVIVDFLSFKVKDSDTSFIGKKNVVARTIDALENELSQIMINATQATLPENEEIGPMIVNFEDEDGVVGRVTVRQDPNLADRIIRYAKVKIPSPLNNIDTTIDAEIAFLA